MHPFDHRVLRQDECFVSDFEDRGVVVQPACGGIGRDRTQPRNKVELAAQLRTSLATASSTPLTNFASRSSKNALATSIYSPIAAPVGTSGRAISS